jgi:hypothetical protein
VVNDADADVVTTTGTTLPSWLTIDWQSGPENAVTTFGSCISGLVDFDADANGNIYAIIGTEIKKVNSEGVLVDFQLSQSLVGPRAMAIDNSGN